MADRPIRFGSFQLDLAAERLWNGSDPIALRPKTWAVLRFLVDRAGELVEKETLLDAVWTDLAVEEKVLNVSIAEIRQALGDSARQPRYVETVHRRGFRFIAALETESTGPRTAPVQAAAPAASRSFVGRQAERSTLMDALEGRGPQRRMVLVSGPAGIGKSRLLAESLRLTTAHVLLGRCIEDGGIPYLPWVEMIRAHLRSEDPASLREGLGEAAAELGRLLPGLGIEAAAPSPTADPELARLRLFERSRASSRASPGATAWSSSSRICSGPMARRCGPCSSWRRACLARGPRCGRRGATTMCRTKQPARRYRP